jgi:hypothetical protein
VPCWIMYSVGYSFLRGVGGLELGEFMIYNMSCHVTSWLCTSLGSDSDSDSYCQPNALVSHNTTQVQGTEHAGQKWSVRWTFETMQ